MVDSALVFALNLTPACADISLYSLP